ncbi:MAG TPA: alpha/beta hydrolase [Rhizomicrobium sp.]|nr:alpha/beta hydrolase [Rhizomicrobium sp.]
MALWTASRKGGMNEIEELRAQFAQLFTRFGPPPSDMSFEPAQLGPVRGEWQRPARAHAGRTILYFHGGGFITGSPETHRGLAGRLAQIGEAELFSVGYRLSPEYFFPAPVRDGIDAYRALLGQGVDPRQVVLAGDGSGGGLAFAVALAIRNAGLAMPAAIAAMSPWADLSLSGWSLLTNQKSDAWLNWPLLFQCARHYLRKANPADAYASPVFANLKDFPPVMVHAGSAEILRDDSSKLGDRAAEAQTPVSVEIYDGMGHLFQCDRESNEAKVSLTRLGQFIRNKTRIEEMAPPQTETSESDANAS